LIRVKHAVIVQG
jgi:quercetin dioxygenase-like cupin family protein